ncbi:hypothetical protein RhiLY_10995 [Ceratobasidium sp. AG-Ba]|nr:hypothetical protein RhiLY_10995 [Ceratobasidium sp. AG-Ba]
MLAPLYEHPPYPDAVKWDYAGHESVDWMLNLLLNFFMLSFDGGRFALMPEFIASVGPAIVTPIIEMRRTGYQVTKIIILTFILGYLYQTMGGGIILPLWWTLHFWLTSHNVVPIPTNYSEATLAGYIAGYVTVSLAMVMYQNPVAIAIWQFFPAYVFVFQVLSLLSQRFLFKTSFNTPYQPFQTIHIFNLLWSAVSHAYTLIFVFKSPSPFSALKDVYLPDLSLSSNLYITLARNFCKWDYICIGLSTAFAGLWLLRGTKSRLYALVAFVLASLLLGVGAGLSCIWIMREIQVSKLCSKSTSVNERKQM